MSDYNTVCLSLYDYHNLKDNHDLCQKELVRLQDISIIPELEHEIWQLKEEVKDLKNKRWWQL